MSEKKNKQETLLADEKIDLVIKEVQRKFGKQALQRFEGNNLKTFEVQVVSTGSILIDQILGIKGYPRGRITEIYGPESSGKTTLGLHAIIEVQKKQGLAAFIDIEQALDAKYATNLGVDLKNLLVSRPENGEQAFDILETLLQSNIFDIIILDSVAALTPKSELEGDMIEQGIGLQARLMSKGLRKINGLISGGKTIVIFINQLREKVGVVFGNPEITPGGRALRFYSSIRMEIRRGEMITNNGVASGNRVKVKIVKNKMAAPFKTTLITINYNRGIDLPSEIFDLALKYNILTKNGVWYALEGKQIGQGKHAVFDWWKNNPQEYEKLFSNIIIKDNLQD